MKFSLSILVSCVLIGSAFGQNPSSQPRELKKFEFEVLPKMASGKLSSTDCAFPDLKLPTNVKILAGGAYGGKELDFQIDQSGHTATQFDVVVNYPNQPVVLMLGSYEPAIWNIGWAAKTRILAVLISGYHRQAVAGLPSSTPLIVSTYDNKGACGNFYVDAKRLENLNPISRRIFSKSVDLVYPAQQGKLVLGEPITKELSLLTSTEITPEEYQDRSAPLAGAKGVDDALQRGFIRRATDADAIAWVDAVLKATPKRDVPPVAGNSAVQSQRISKPGLHDTYVVLKKFTYPSGLFGAHSVNFLIPKGVPRPQGNPGHCTIYDFNDVLAMGQ
jgi:hypothetical protein